VFRVCGRAGDQRRTSEHRRIDGTTRTTSVFAPWSTYPDGSSSLRRAAQAPPRQKARDLRRQVTPTTRCNCDANETPQEAPPRIANAEQTAAIVAYLSRAVWRDTILNQHDAPAIGPENHSSVAIMLHVYRETNGPLRRTRPEGDDWLADSGDDQMSNPVTRIANGERSFSKNVLDVRVTHSSPERRAPFATHSIGVSGA
jgi:hypothetical protein